MRKTMSLTAAAFSVLALAACGGSSEPGDSSEDIPPAATDGLEAEVGDSARIIEGDETLFTLTVEDISEGAPEACEGAEPENAQFMTLDTTVEAADDAGNGTIEGTEFTATGPGREAVEAGTIAAGGCNMEVGLVPSVSEGDSAEGVIVLDVPKDAESVTYQRDENEVTWTL